jgi:hypothetical protein
MSVRNCSVSAPLSRAPAGSCMLIASLLLQ